jgi:cysteine desulfurase/selenocysteine lyase
MLDLRAIRRQFPVLAKELDGQELAYLDDAATTQKPKAVLDALRKFYETQNGNPHRGMHPFAERATLAYEAARQTVRRLLGANRPEEIVFTRGTTEGINLVARTFGETLGKGDIVAVSVLEHHSNIVPWLQLKDRKGIDVRWIGMDDSGHLQMESLDEILETGRVKLVAVTGQSNVLGVRPPLDEIIPRAHEAGAKVLVDAAQLAPHAPIDVQKLDCDFLAVSGHKLYGPMGIGALYGKQELLEAMPPFLGGGMMIEEVREDLFTSASIPGKFEAGTQPVADAVGFAAAIQWMEQFSWADRQAHERTLTEALLEALGSVPDLRILGPGNPDEISGCVSFTLDGVHPHDLTEVLGRQGICLRAGHHCAQPLHRRLGVPASTRVSVGIENTVEEIERLPDAITAAAALLRK